MPHPLDSLALTTGTLGALTPTAATGQDEEMLIEDARAALSPTEEVEQKLLRALHASPALVSQLQRINRPRPS
jgi:hypothetical protein